MADNTVTNAGELPSGTLTTPGPSPSGEAARLAMSGLAAGAENVLKDIAGRVFNVDFRNVSGSPINPMSDWRVRISMQRPTADIFYNSQRNPVMYPLAQTNGVIFPYTPTVTLTHQARYGSTPLTHSNYNSYFYEGSEVQNISINGDFTVQDVQEGQYLMAVIQFFRACTKMFFGKEALAGTPPPMVFLDGYGSTYLPHVPCVVTSFSHTMPAEVDYVEVPVAVNYSPGDDTGSGPYLERTRLPTMSSIGVTLQPIYSRTNIANNFTLEKYSSGALTRDTNAPSGGFI